ncbi:MAG: hypothetical protein ACLR4Z_13860 [Butyricicoccaceae bacterium]
MKKKQTLALLLAGAMLVPNAFAASPRIFTISRPTGPQPVCAAPWTTVC